MEHLFIITRRDGAFAEYLSRFPHLYKMTAKSGQFVYFAYVGATSPKQKVLQILSTHNFSEFSLDKEKNNYLRFKVYVE